MKVLQFAVAAIQLFFCCQSAHASQVLTADDVEAFVDGYMQRALTATGTAGAAVAVVKDGAVLLQKGYGYADLEKRTPVQAEQTMFRLASVSKLFVWTAVMQLVEQGRLDLDRDVNDYLDFQIPATFDRAITLRHLMTHTAGFEDVTKDQYPAHSEELAAGAYIKHNAPRRIFPPGTRAAYSNYGAGLASYIVERVTGESLETYVERHIFQPLGMRHATLRQPVPAELAPFLAQGYRSMNDSPSRFILVSPAATGGGSASASDMARFMLAHLQDGAFGQARILQPGTVRLMHSDQYVPAPQMNGIALGFGVQDRYGQRIIGHGGTLSPFFSDMVLLTEANVGVFTVVNGAGPLDGGHRIPVGLSRAIIERYFSAPIPVEATLASAVADAQRVVGSYQPTRRTESSLKFVQLLMQTQVTALDDGTIEVSALKDLSGTPKRWREVGPLAYREVGGAGRVKFVADENGRPLYFTTDEFPPVVLFERIEGMRKSSVVLPMLGLAVGLLVFRLLLLPICWLVRRHYGQRLELHSRMRAVRIATAVGIALALCVLAGWSAFLMMAIADEAVLSSNADGWLFLLYATAVLALVGLAACIAYGISGLTDNRYSAWARGGQVLSAAAAAYVAWFMITYGLLSFSVTY